MQDACTALIESVQARDFQHIPGGVKGHDNFREMLLDAALDSV